MQTTGFICVGRWAATWPPLSRRRPHGLHRAVPDPAQSGTSPTPFKA